MNGCKASASQDLVDVVHILIPECPAYDKCRSGSGEADCSVCAELSEKEWKKHVRKVLKRGEKRAAN
jgi:hypothetical protein